MNWTHFIDYPDTSQIIHILSRSSGHFYLDILRIIQTPSKLCEILQPIMSMLQKLSRFPKTFRSALLMRSQVVFTLIGSTDTVQLMLLKDVTVTAEMGNQCYLMILPGQWRQHLVTLLKIAKRCCWCSELSVFLGNIIQPPESLIPWLGSRNNNAATCSTTKKESSGVASP